MGKRWAWMVGVGLAVALVAPWRADGQEQGEVCGTPLAGDGITLSGSGDGVFPEQFELTDGNWFYRLTVDGSGRVTVQLAQVDGANTISLAAGDEAPFTEANVATVYESLGGVGQYVAVINAYNGDVTSWTLTLSRQPIR